VTKRILSGTRRPTWNPDSLKKRGFHGGAMSGPGSAGHEAGPRARPTSGTGARQMMRLRCWRLFGCQRSRWGIATFSLRVRRLSGNRQPSVWRKWAFSGRVRRRNCGPHGPCGCAQSSCFFGPGGRSTATRRVLLSIIWIRAHLHGISCLWRKSILSQTPQ
jgi:hypothetical protein